MQIRRQSKRNLKLAISLLVYLADCAADVPAAGEWKKVRFQFCRSLLPLRSPATTGTVCQPNGHSPSPRNPHWCRSENLDCPMVEDMWR